MNTLEKTYIQMRHNGVNILALALYHIAEYDCSDEDTLKAVYEAISRGSLDMLITSLTIYDMPAEQGPIFDKLVYTVRDRFEVLLKSAA